MPAAAEEVEEAIGPGAGDEAEEAAGAGAEVEGATGAGDGAVSPAGRVEVMVRMVVTV